MAVAFESKSAPLVHEGKVTDLKVAQACTSSSSPSLNSSEKILLSGHDTNTTQSTFHIYHKHEHHLLITPLPDPSKDRRAGPNRAEQKAKRLAKKSRKASNLPPAPIDENAFFLHMPYLSFHSPPHVLYQGDTRNGTPAVLIHTSSFWREYKIQLGPTIAKVLDPRGVVGSRYNADEKTRKSDGTALKGYRVRGWRLWGETGKEYVHSVKKNRDAGVGEDPDVPCEEDEKEVCKKADQVVYLRWTKPLSKHTRQYSFSYCGVEFLWKGTGTVKEDRTGGACLRYCHLKLVARIPLPNSSVTADAKKEEKEDHKLEICLGKYTSSVASKKSGVLVLYDEAILRLVEEHIPEVLGEVKGEKIAERDDVAREETRGEGLLTNENNGRENGTVEENRALEIARLKKSMLYQIVIATALCMIKSEKEKRHTIIDIILTAAAEGGGAGG